LLDNFALRELVITSRLQSLLSLLPRADAANSIAKGSDIGFLSVQSHLFRFFSLCENHELTCAALMAGIVLISFVLVF